MVEPLKELNRICQKPDYRKKGNWMARHIVRDAALPITWLLLHTPASANQVTLASLVTAVAGVILLSLPSPVSFFFGALLLELWYLLDHVDGQIARYRKTASLTGRFFDFVTHHLIHGVLFFGLGYYVFLKTQDHLFILWGFLTSVSMFMFNLIYDIQYKTFFEQISSKPVAMKGSSAGVPLEAEKKSSAARRLFSLGHKAAEVHVVMNALMAAALIDLVFQPAFDLRIALFVVYGFLIPTLAVIKITYYIVNGVVDSDFEKFFADKESS